MIAMEGVILVAFVLSGMIAMRFIFSLAALALAGFSAKSTAADYMQEVKREPAAAVGNAQEIAKRAVACIAKNTDMEANPFVEIDSGLVVATSTVQGRKFKLDQQQLIRTKVTVETKDSKFRVSHSEIMVRYISSYGRSDEFKRVESNSKAVKDIYEFLASSDSKLASCVSSSADDF